MLKVAEEEEQLTGGRGVEEIVDTNSYGTDSTKKKRKGKKGKKKKRKRKGEGTDSGGDSEQETVQESKKKTSINNDQFIINGTYNLIKMLGFGTFGEIHLAFDTSNKQLRAIKFEIASQKN